MHNVFFFLASNKNNCRKSLRLQIGTCLYGYIYFKHQSYQKLYTQKKLIQDDWLSSGALLNNDSKWLQQNDTSDS